MYSICLYVCICTQSTGRSKLCSLFFCLLELFRAHPRTTEPCNTCCCLTCETPTSTILLGRPSFCAMVLVETRHYYSGPVLCLGTAVSDTVPLWPDKAASTPQPCRARVHRSCAQDHLFKQTLAQMANSAWARHICFHTKCTGLCGQPCQDPGLPPP